MGTTRRTSGWFVKLLPTIALLAPLILGTAGTAHAAPATTGRLLDTTSTSTSHTIPYDQYWNFTSTFVPHHVCVRYRVQGTFTYNDAVYSPKQNLVQWTAIDLTNPSLTAYVYDLNTGGCGVGSPVTVSSLTMTQYWSGYACSFSPSLSFGFPFSVTVGGWGSCGNKTLAKSFSDFDSADSNFHQGNSGYQGGFSDVINTPSNPPCYGVYVSSTFYENNFSDGFTSSIKEVCLPYLT